MSKEEFLPDHIEASITVRNSKYVSSTIVKGRRIVLYGVPIHLDDCTKCKTVHMTPEIPCLSPLIQIIKANPDVNEYKWSGEVWSTHA